MLLLHHCALQKFHMTDCQNTRDQITRIESPIASDQTAFCAFHSFLVEVQTNAGYIIYMQRMRNNNLETRIVE